MGDEQLDVRGTPEIHKKNRNLKGGSGIDGESCPLDTPPSELLQHWEHI